MAKTRYRINEITSPVIKWEKGGAYLPCPAQWVDKATPTKVVITLPDGSVISDTVRSTSAGAGYVPVGGNKAIEGKAVLMRTAKKLGLPSSG